MLERNLIMQACKTLTCLMFLCSQPVFAENELEIRLNNPQAHGDGVLQFDISVTNNSGSETCLQTPEAAYAFAEIIRISDNAILVNREEVSHSFAPDDALFELQRIQPGEEISFAVKISAEDVQIVYSDGNDFLGTFGNKPDDLLIRMRLQFYPCPKRLSGPRGFISARALDELGTSVVFSRDSIRFRFYER